jgi:hypothetical protein
MAFDSLDEVENSTSPMHMNVVFSVRIRAQGKKSDVVEHKKFVCSTEWFTKRKVKPNKQKKLFKTRGGCNATAYVRLSQDAQLFVARMERKKEANSTFFYDFVVDEHKKSVYIFWVDATSRKNYRHFGDLVYFDAIYSTNHYNMIFAHFTGVKHQMQSVLFGAAFIENENIASYEWLFQTFLLVMWGKALRLIITDEDASIKSVIRTILSDTLHRFCMWHIMEKVPKKIGPPINHERAFWSALNTYMGFRN